MKWPSARGPQVNRGRSTGLIRRICLFLIRWYTRALSACSSEASPCPSLAMYRARWKSYSENNRQKSHRRYSRIFVERLYMTTRSELSEVEDGHTELMRAALAGDTVNMRELLAAGADVNAKDGEGRTALMFAVTNMHTDIARELLEHGADVNATANDGGTALMLAASSGDTEGVRALLRKGADPSGKYVQSGKTALTLAKENNHAEIVELLSGGQSKTVGNS